MKQKKPKQKAISIFRLYVLANQWVLKSKTKKEAGEKLAYITEYLKYVHEHKNDEFNGPSDIKASWLDVIKVNLK